MDEIELTFLGKYLPEGLEKCESKEIVDVYLPFDHSNVRLRKSGKKYTLTKKNPVTEGNASHQKEQTIVLDKHEFDYLKKTIKGKYLKKIRYYYSVGKNIAEIDVFREKLKGLVLVDFEFDSFDDMKRFEAPDFCGADVTQEKLIAGGMVCGKSYEDIEKKLKRFGYKKIETNL